MLTLCRSRILIGSHHIIQSPEVPPLIFVGTKGEDFFAPSGEAQIRSDDGEHTFFGHQREEARRNDVDAGESQGPRVR